MKNSCFFEDYFFIKGNIFKIIPINSFFILFYFVFLFCLLDFFGFNFSFSLFWFVFLFCLIFWLTSIVKNYKNSNFFLFRFSNIFNFFLELIASSSRLLRLSIRLRVNLLVGHILIVYIELITNKYIFWNTWFFCNFLEIFVILLQSFIFSYLVVRYIKSSV